MKVNGLPFLVSYSRILKFRTTTELVNTKAPNIISAIALILKVYGNMGFTVSFIASDNGFAPLQQNEAFLSLRVLLNATSEGEHEPYSERFIRTVKEKCRVCYILVPFTRLPRRLAIELVYCQIFWYNFPVPSNYISENMGPAEIVVRQTHGYNKICGIGSMFGEYV